MTKKRFTLEERDCYDYGIRVVDIIKDNGTELPQSTACDLLNELVKENEELISIKRFANKYGINIFNIDEAFRRCWNDNGDLVKENQKLKTQLLHGDGVCDICKHEYLVKTGEYYVSECKKGHEECSKIDLAYCGDFEVKECKE